MELNEKYVAGFINQLDASQRGDTVFLPNPMARMGKVFNIMQSRYKLISGATGSGKTAYTDYTDILAPWSMHDFDALGIHWEVNYFSLERKQLFKHAKWVAWMIHRDNPEILVSADQILGWDGGPLNEEGYKLVRSYDEEMSRLLEHVYIRDGKVSAEVIRRIITKRGLDLGDLYRSNDEGVFFRDSLLYKERFSDKKLVRQTKIGPIPYIELEHKGVKFTIDQDDHRYFPNNPKTFVFFVIDGINLLGSKEVIDAISVELADARDVYGFSPIVVTQQNRAMGDISRMKLHGNDLSPQIEDIFKSSQMGYDADIIVGLFDPLRYKAFDKEGLYGGYCITPMDAARNQPSMQTLSGTSRFRSAHILKNSFGADGAKFGMRFTGECGHFETLPFPDNQIEMEQIYSDIRRGL